MDILSVGSVTSDILSCCHFFVYNGTTETKDMAKFFFYVFMDRDGVEVRKHAKKERGQYPAILTEKAWSKKDLHVLYGQRNLLSFGT